MKILTLKTKSFPKSSIWMRVETHLQSQQKSNGNQERCVHSFYVLSCKMYFGFASWMKTSDVLMRWHLLGGWTLENSQSFAIWCSTLSAGPDQALQPDTEQSRKEEATWRTREFLHLVYWSCWCWRRWAWRSHQGWYLAKPPAVLLGMFGEFMQSFTAPMWCLLQDISQLFPQSLKLLY